jgi:hypothetical protein
MVVLFLCLHYSLDGIWAIEYFLEGPVMGSNKDSPPKATFKKTQ